MKRLILDTSELLRWWNLCRSKLAGELTPRLAEAWARQLIKHHDTNAIVTPVFLEVVAGTTGRKGLQLMEAYLKPFACVDEQRILTQDWRNAIRLARRVPRDRRPRDLGDCLIRAIADRLKYEVFTLDEGFPR